MEDILQVGFLPRRTELGHCPSDKQRLQAGSVSQGTHLIIHRFALVSLGCIQYPGQEMYVGGAVQKDCGLSKHPMDCEVDVCLFFEGLIPGVARLRAVAPGGAGDRFDGLYRHISFFAGPQKLNKISSIAGILHHGVIVREKHRVEIEALQGGFVQASDVSAVTGDANKPHQSLFSSLDKCF